MDSSGKDLSRRGDYGFDAPVVPLLLSVGTTLLGAAAALSAVRRRPIAAVIAGHAAISMLVVDAIYLHTTRRGKFTVWSQLLDGLDLRGDERLLDLGCGRGAVLLLAAKRLPQGKAIGVDLWRTVDQSGNDPSVTRRNAELEGVAKRVELETADLRALPFEDDSFDVVVSSAAIHNIRSDEGRLQAIDEAVRVLKPGGRLLIVDMMATDAYQERLRQQGMQEVKRQRLGWRIWYGGPWAGGQAVGARKPA